MSKESEELEFKVNSVLTEMFDGSFELFSNILRCASGRLISACKVVVNATGKDDKGIWVTTIVVPTSEDQKELSRSIDKFFSNYNGGELFGYNLVDMQHIPDSAKLVNLSIYNTGNSSFSAATMMAGD